MGFKLVRVDAVEPYKVLLPLGSHSVGRGKFLDCNDNRVSRNHAELIVTSDSILLKSLHRNPCFLKKKPSIDIIVISQLDTQILCNGDQFGLTPDSFWYEVIQCTEDLSVESSLSNSATNVKENENLAKCANDAKNGDTQSYNQDDFKNKFNCSGSLPHATLNTSISFSQENEALPVKEFENSSDESFTPIKDMDTTSIELAAESTTKQFAESINEYVDSTNQPDKSLTPIKDMNTTSIELPAESTTKQFAESINEHVDSTNQPLDSANQPIGSTNQSIGSTLQPIESTNQQIGSINQLADSTSPLAEHSNAVTPTKREHSEDDSPCDVKRVKTEPESPDKVDNNASTGAIASNQPVKTEPDSPQAKPGSSNDNGGPSTDSNANPSDTMATPAKPTNRSLRERCMYGANCYRKNPLHKAQFSHPSDGDWGAGPRAECPWGAGCRRADPRHWRDHDHPPGVLPPPPRLQHNRPGMRVVRRHGNIFYINANSVHFYDDHFDVEDSDGDSVDYDYEF